MGGNALASFGAKRKHLWDYQPIVKKVVAAILSIGITRKPVELPYYFSKTDFEDADILVTNWNARDNLNLVRKLNAQVYKVNSNVTSMLVDGLQVDIISMPEEDWFSALTYYSYNDLGNLMGKLFHKFGLKYGHRGLTMPLRTGTNQYAEILISKDFYKIFKFLGLSYDVFSDGFNDLESIYDFVISSKHFNPNVFLFENLNHKSRIRDKKRSSYNGFLDYISVDEISGPDIVWPEIETDKDSFLPVIFDHFPEALAAYEAEKSSLAKSIAVREKISGSLISNWIEYDTSGIRLGCFITHLKSTWNGFGEWVLEKSDEWLEAEVKRIYKEWKEKNV